MPPDPSLPECFASSANRAVLDSELSVLPHPLLKALDFGMSEIAKLQNCNRLRNELNFHSTPRSSKCASTWSRSDISIQSTWFKSGSTNKLGTNQRMIYRTSRLATYVEHPDLRFDREASFPWMNSCCNASSAVIRLSFSQSNREMNFLHKSLCFPCG